MKHCVIVGVGQLGGVFAHGLLRVGYTVTPVRRADPMDQVALEVDPEFVLVAVGESDLPGVLASLPSGWRDRVALLQNELLPGAWSGLHEPTVATVWFEKKKPIAAHSIRTTPIAGPHADTLVAALSALDLAATTIPTAELVPALVLKNLYILSANVAGLAAPPGTTTGKLWHSDNARIVRIAGDALRLQRALLRESGHHQEATNLDESALMEALGAALIADPDHLACGRSAAARRERALSQATELGIDIHHIRAASKE